MPFGLADYATRYNTIRFERSDDGVLEMTLHTKGGEVQWSVMPEGHHNEMGLAFADIARDPENKVVILTGTGRNFIATRAQEKTPDPNLREMWERMYAESQLMLEGFLSIPVPVISAVNGPLLIHSEVPVMADIVLAADHAEFADTTHMKVGNVCGDGTQVIWPMLLGPNRGRYFMLTGKSLSAKEAHDLGVVAEVLPLEQLMPRARELAQQMAKHPRRALRHAKTLLVRNLRHRLRDELDLGLSSQGLAILGSAY